MQIVFTYTIDNKEKKRIGWLHSEKKIIGNDKKGKVLKALFAKIYSKGQYKTYDSHRW